VSPVGSCAERPFVVTISSYAGVMLKRFWEWRVDGQVVSAKLNLLTSRETIAIDGTTVLDRISWRLRNEVPLQFDSGRGGRVVMSVGWNLGPRCVLEVEGETIEPHIRPVLSKVRRVVISVGLALLVAFLGLMIAPGLLGGSELPPPRWTARDLTPIPDEEDNAWHAITGPAEPLAVERWLLDERERISPSDLQAAKEDLAQPEIVALLAHMPEVLERSELAVPDDEASRAKSLQLHTWRYWLALSLSSEIEREPVEAVRTLTQTLPMWINCANGARGGVVYMICAKHVRRDLALMLSALEHLPRGENETRVVIEAAVREAPTLTTENIIRASYIESYGLLAALTERHHVWVDKRATVGRFNRLLSPSPSKTFCDARRETDIYKVLYTYNYLGDAYATAAARYSCIGLDQLNATIESVADARGELLVALERPPSW
jgi:hypothetical protein